MRKTKKLFTRTMASIMVATMVFSQGSLAFAQDVKNDTVAIEETDEIGKLDKILMEGKETPHFTYPDGTIYYDSGVSVDSLKEMERNDVTQKTAGLHRKYDFQGWDDHFIENRFPDTSRSLVAKWSHLAKIIQLNSGLAKISAQNGLIETRNTGFQNMTSLKEAEESTLSQFGSNNAFKKALTKENKKQYVIAYGSKYRAKGGSDTNEAYVVTYLYNFKYTPMITDSYLQWAGENGVAGVEDNVKLTKEAGLGCYNDSPLAKTDSQHVETDQSQSSTKEENASSQASLTVSAKTSIEAGGGPVKVGAELGYSVGAAFSKGWSKSESETFSKKIGSDMSVTLAPYSGVNLVTAKQSGEYKQIVDFPLALSYDVKLVSYGTENNPRTVLMATYEGREGSKTRVDAQTDLYQRYFKQQEDQDVKYKGDAYPFDVEGRISICAKTAPFISAKATAFNGKVNDRVSTTSNFIALHPLRSVDTTKEMRTISMKPGATFYGRDIPVFGYLDKKYCDANSNTAKYVTFNQQRGHWELKSGRGIIEITTDDQKRQQIKGLKEGKATIIYRIDENCYNSNEGREKFATNDSLEATAEMTIIVSRNAKMSTGFINQALYALENDGTGWTVDNGYILGSEDGDALTDATVPVSGLEGIELEANGKTLSTRNGLESVQYSLTGENAEEYDVYYRSYVKDLGWLNWTSNDEISGTSGFDKEITAVQVMILEKDITPTADDSITPAYFIKNTDNSDASFLFEQIKAIHEEYKRPAIQEITYTTESEDMDESNESESTDAETKEVTEDKNILETIGDMIVDLFNSGKDEN